MPKVKGKEQLCSCPKYKTHFKSHKGLRRHSLFDRYSDIENIVNTRIDENYCHFLAQPEVDEDTIYWFSKPYRETPRRLSELQGAERARYEQIKNNTLAHYRNVISSLKSEGKNSEAECLKNAVEFVNDDFVYCFDGKTVLGIWGMQLKEHVREPLGIAIIDGVFNPKNKSQPLVPDEPPEPEPPTEEPPVENKPATEPEPEEPPENPYTVRFNAGENGYLNGVSEYSKHAGETVKPSEVPRVETKKGYEFTGWDKNPNNYTVTDDTEFTAQYREI
ncbi:MAG: InlB B-repeat-containing protein, partial [Prevotellaceae bacterium]|nr:InlB B-repeat-containing protein [Prevotellaceae bacterium]